MLKDLKKIIQDYWTNNVPGLEKAKSQIEEINSDFFRKVDEYRVKNEPYVVPLIEYLSREKGKVLEVGCGLGADLRNFSRRGMQVVGVDLSLKNVELTKRGLEFCGLPGEVLCSDAENLPFKDESFDKYYSFGVLHHTPNTARAIDEAYRVLKKGGECVVMLYHKGYAYSYINLVYGIKRIFISEERLISDHYDFTPLSKMYSKKETTKLFSKFKKVEFEVTTFAYGGIDANRKLKFVHYLLKNNFLMNKLGQFLIIKAEK